VIDVVSYVSFASVERDKIAVAEAGCATLNSANAAHAFWHSVRDRARIVAETAMDEALREIKTVVDDSITIFVRVVAGFYLRLTCRLSAIGRAVRTIWIGDVAFEYARATLSASSTRSAKLKALVDSAIAIVILLVTGFKRR
jgi:hypothetical protein